MSVRKTKKFGNAAAFSNTGNEASGGNVTFEQQQQPYQDQQQQPLLAQQKRSRRFNRVRAGNSGAMAVACAFVVIIVVAVCALMLMKKNMVTGGTSLSTVGMPQCSTVPFRTQDGSDRGMHGWLGAEGTRLGRYVEPGGFTQAYDDRGRPNARLVSNALCAHDEAVTPKDAAMSSLMWSFGQFLDHTISLAPGECGGSASRIRTSMAGDPHFDADGAGAVLDIGSSDFLEEPRGHRHPINIITHFVDENAVYGSTSGRTQLLRTFEGGLLRTTTADGQVGEYPPYNEAGVENVGGRRNADMFLLGDLRANEQIPLTAMHTLFVREHNYQARRMTAADPSLTDECAFQQAKKMVVAEIQHTVFEEFLPVLLGEPLPPAALDRSGSADPRIYAEFSSAAFRMGHSLVNGLILRLNPRTGAEQQPPLPLHEGFANPQQLKRDGIESVLLGLLKQNCEQVDLKVVDSLRQFLFFKDGAPLDLVAINIVRGREQGLPDFSTLRDRLGLGPLTEWTDLTTDTAVWTALRSVYGPTGYRNLDAFIGLLAEDKPEGRPVGRTLGVLLRDQFLRLRDSDPQYYKFDPFFGRDDLAYLKENGKFRDILLRNTDIAPGLVQENPFLFSAP